MIFPLYICETCGRYGGLGLSFSQTMTKAARGERVEQSNSIVAPECPDGHAPMRLVGENDRLKIIPSEGEK